jgi:hypothetical protein
MEAEGDTLTRAYTWESVEEDSDVVELDLSMPWEDESSAPGGNIYIYIHV